jgi:capsule polysaccharide export protein KpsE/RkpR
MTSEDAQMIMELRNDLTKVSGLLEQAKDKEDKQRHIILNLKSHIENLHEQLQQMSNDM